MFYSNKRIKLLLICDVCEQEFDDPRIVPCGKTFCHKCINESNCKGGSFNCTCNDKVHAIPENGFPLNEIVLSLIEEPIYDLYRGEKIEDLKSKLEDAKIEADKLEYGLEHGEDKIKEYCASIRNEIDLATEKNINAIQNYRDDLLKQVNDYEKECLAKIKDKEHFSDCKSIIESSLRDTESFYNKWHDSLEDIECEDDIEDAVYDFNNLKSPRKNDMLLNTYLFLNKKIKFNPSTNQLSPTAIGTLDFDNVSGYIDFKNITKMSLESWNICKNKEKSYIIDFDYLKNGNMLCCYGQDLQTLCFCEIDKNKNIVKKVTKKYNDNPVAQMKKVKLLIKTNRILLQVCYSDNSSFILILHPNTYEISIRHDFNYRLTDFDLNSNSIYCLENESNILEYSLDFDKKDESFFNRKFSDIRVNDKYYYFLELDGTVCCYEMKDFEFYGDIGKKKTYFPCVMIHYWYITILQQETCVISILMTTLNMNKKVPIEISPSYIKWNKTNYIIYDKEAPSIYF